jgi:hypothetical protein
MGQSALWLRGGFAILQSNSLARQSNDLGEGRARISSDAPFAAYLRTPGTTLFPLVEMARIRSGEQLLTS